MLEFSDLTQPITVGTGDDFTVRLAANSASSVGVSGMRSWTRIAG